MRGSKTTPHPTLLPCAAVLPGLVDAAADQMVRTHLRGRLPPATATASRATEGHAAAGPAAAVPVPATGQTRVRLSRHDVAHMALEEDEAGEGVALYHSAQNTLRYQEAEEGCEVRAGQRRGGTLWHGGRQSTGDLQDS